jgi:UDP-N-acetylglucosamine--N-acetylmuramyl-(pentapeptide) pyrophosphoryl-undecaprenol N-acetylglucosamine transferase
VRVVVGTGGYVSAPAVLGARLARRPALLVEPNAGAGVANRWLSRWASEAAVAYPAAAAALRCPSTVTGVPVRREFFAVPERPPAAGGPRLLVLGGSQGSRQLNERVPAALGRAAGRLPGLAVVHQAGAGKVEETAAAYAAAGLADAAAVFPFLAAVAEAMAAADLVVSRAGAMTAAELCAAGRAALLVPLAIAGGHQADNARELAAAGAAVVVTSAEADAAGGAPLAAALGDLLADRDRLVAMGRAARSLADPRAAAAIADRVEALAAPGVAA